LQGDDTLLERGKLRCQRTIGIQDERCAVEHQFILTAHLIEIDKRQVAFGHARHGDREPDIALAACIRRAVRHDQDFGARLGKTFDHVFVVRRFFEPCVLTDGDADP